MDLIQKYYLPWHFPLRKEFAGILVILILFLLFPGLVRLFDITSAPIDPGAFSAVILAVAALLLFKAVTWWLIKAIWPVLAEYSDQHFERNFKGLLSWQKVVIYLVFYFLLLYGFILVLGEII
jgi:succinate dehydrogenase hydrophobic anchor subunit